MIPYSENNVLIKYQRAFDESPFLLFTTGYSNPRYVRLMKKALERGYPLSKEEIGEEFEGNYDLVEKIICIDDETEELIFEYEAKFGKKPPEDRFISFDDPIYKQHLKDALATNKKITKRTFTKYYQIDYVEDFFWKGIYEQIIMELSNTQIYLNINILDVPKCLLKRDILLIDEKAKEEGKFYFRLDENKAKPIHYRSFYKWLFNSNNDIYLEFKLAKFFKR